MSKPYNIVTVDEAFADYDGGATALNLEKV